MDFRIRLALSIAVLVGCTAVMGIAALAAMNQQHDRLRSTNERYEELRGLYDIGSRASSARLLLNSAAPDPAEVRRQLLGAVQATDRLVLRISAAPEQRRSHLRATLENMRSSLEASLVAEARPGGPGASIAAINACLSQIAALSGEASGAIESDRQAITKQVERATWTLGATLIITLVLAVALGIVHHRAVSRPLRSLRQGIDRIAAHRLDEPISEIGPREFRALIRQFNHMSEEIRSLRESLSRQVETKGSQLIRSERLAGLGYLAAGLAHEINNPLGVIGGYAETMLRRFESEPHAASDDAAARTHELADALRVIAEEVFRCRDITSGLLQMTRGGSGDDRLEPIDLFALVERTAAMLARLPLSAERQLTVERTHTGPLLARGRRAQLTQVFVNLITNALEAVEPHVGTVRITIASQSGSALLRIEDNGCGMTADTLQHVFDPLFTDKPRRGLAGFGLGLSVSHSIIEQHGGRIDAMSDGPGRGSTFIIELPAITASSFTETAT